MSESTVQKTTPVKKLVELLNLSGAAKRAIASESGELGKQISTAVKSHHLHKKAFSWISSLDGMDSLRRADLLRAFDVYRDQLEAEGGRWHAESGDLIEGAPKRQPEAPPPVPAKKPRKGAKAAEKAPEPEAEADTGLGDEQPEQSAADTSEEDWNEAEPEGSAPARKGLTKEPITGMPSAGGGPLN